MAQRLDRRGEDRRIHLDEDRRILAAHRSWDVRPAHRRPQGLQNHYESDAWAWDRLRIDQRREALAYAAGILLELRSACDRKSAYPAEFLRRAMERDRN